MAPKKLKGIRAFLDRRKQEAVRSAAVVSCSDLWKQVSADVAELYGRNSAGSDLAGRFGGDDVKAAQLSDKGGKWALGEGRSQCPEGVKRARAIVRPGDVADGAQGEIGWRFRLVATRLINAIAAPSRARRGRRSKKSKLKRQKATLNKL